MSLVILAIPFVAHVWVDHSRITQGMPHKFFDLFADLLPHILKARIVEFYQ